MLSGPHHRKSFAEPDCGPATVHLRSIHSGGGGSGDSRRGSILVAVLALTVFLALVVVAFMQEATTRIKHSGIFQERDDLRVEAYSALEVTFAVLSVFSQIDGALWSPVQGWSDPLGFARYQPGENVSIDVRIFDESSRIPLSHSNPTLLREIFRHLEYDYGEADTLADTLIDWMDGDESTNLNGYDGDDYYDRDPPFKAKSSMVESWDEFRLMETFRELFFDEFGRPTPQFERFKQMVSLHHEGSSVNVNTASPDVLEVLEELGEIDAYGVSRRLVGFDGEAGTEDDEIIRERDNSLFLSESSIGSTEISLLRIEITATRGESQFLLSVLANWGGADPSADSAAGTREDTAGSDPPTEGEEISNDDENTAPDVRIDSNRKSETAGAQLGYPFQILRLVENQRI